jgi:hypothetical protein
MFVYVLRKTAAGVEGDMDIMDAEHGRRRSEPGLLQAELTDYHRRRKPRRNANIVYIRVEPDPPDPADVCAPSSRTLY